MKASSLDVSENGSRKGKSADTTVCNTKQVELLVEGLEGIITPEGGVALKMIGNHNVTLVADDAAIQLEVEELEDVIAPGVSPNHNETMAGDDDVIQLEVEELEDVIAPGLSPNHNETIVRDSV